MIITIHQPEHLPWLGLFNKIAKAETFVILDSVQYEKNYFQNRNRILGSNGVQWLSVPVSTKGHMEGTIATTEISLSGGNANWKEKYLRTVQQSYGKHPYFSEIYPVLENAIRTETNLLYDINMAIIKSFCDCLEKDGLHGFLRHCSNSAGIMELPEANLDLVRAGISIYGIYPSGEMDRGFSLRRRWS